MGSEATAKAAGPKPAPRRKLSPGPGLAAKEVAAHQLARIHRAMVEIVAEHGYKALKVRDVVRLAEVSTRAFYEHFGSKEDCFLQTHDLITRRATRRMIAAQAGERDWRKRPRLVFEEFVRDLEKEPDSARLALVEAYGAGEESLAQAWRAERIFEGMLAECFARTPGGMVVPPLVVEGMVAGIAGVSRSRLLDGKVAQLSGSSQALVDWALCYSHRSVGKLAALDRRSVWRDTTLEPLTARSANGDHELWSSTGDRALILAAVAKLSASKGYAGLTAPRIRAAAGVSRRKFSSYFDDVEDCYLAALEQGVGEALAQAARAQTAARSQPGGVYRAIAALCRHIVANPFLTRVCLTDDFPPGATGMRSKQRLAGAVTELLGDEALRSDRLDPSASEATVMAIWSLFHHHIVRSRPTTPRISATLAYFAMAPSLDRTEVIAAIEAEQSA